MQNISKHGSICCQFLEEDLCLCFTSKKNRCKLFCIGVLVLSGFRDENQSTNINASEFLGKKTG